MVATIGRPLGKARVGEPYGEAPQPRGHEDIGMSAWPEDIGDMGCPPCPQYLIMYIRQSLQNLRTVRA